MRDTVTPARSARIMMRLGRGGRERARAEFGRGETRARARVIALRGRGIAYLVTPSFPFAAPTRAGDTARFPAACLWMSYIANATHSTMKNKCAARMAAGRFCAAPSTTSASEGM